LPRESEPKRLASPQALYTAPRRADDGWSTMSHEEQRGELLPHSFLAFIGKRVREFLNHGSPLHPDVLRKDVLYPVLDRLGISRSSGASGFHTFRHSAASILNQQTGNLKLAQKLLGHSTINMTADVYTHTSAEAERGAALAIERAIYGDLFPSCSSFENGNKNAAIN
jgi:integrase